MQIGPQEFISLLIATFGLIVSMRLIWVARKSELKNQYWNGSTFFLIAIFSILTAFRLIIPRIFLLGSGLTLFLQIIFIGKLFYEDNNKPVIIILVIYSLLYLAVLIFNFSVINYTLGHALLCTGGIVVNSWYAANAIKTAGKIQKNKYVEDWIKKRYSLIKTYTILTVVRWIIQWILESTFEGHFWIFLILLVSITIYFKQFIAWIMPKRLKQHYNRNYNPMAIYSEADWNGIDNSEKFQVGAEKLETNMDMVNFLSEKFNYIVGFPLIQCKGLVEGAYYLYLDDINIKDKKNAFLLNYKTWKKILKTYFKAMLMKTSLPDREGTLQKILDELETQQSLVSLVF